MAALGAKRFLELGAGSVCAGLLKKCLDEQTSFSCGEADTLDEAGAFVG